MPQFRLERLKCLSDPTIFARIKKMENNAFWLKMTQYITISILLIGLSIIGSCTYTSIHSENIDSTQLPLRIAKAQLDVDDDKVKAQIAHSEEEIARAKTEQSKNFFASQMEIEKAKAETSKAYFDSLPKQPTPPK